MSDRTCSVDGCGRPYCAKDLCASHWARWSRTGKTGGPFPPRRSVEERFWAKVNKTDDCWLWTASLSGAGYGQLSVRNRPALAHRLAYELCVGPIPHGMDLDHICRVRHCVNPDHLRPVTHKQNLEHTDGRALPSNRTSGIRGVSWNSQKRRWQARVEHHGQRHHVGTFTDLDIAANAVREARNRLFTHNDADRTP